MANGGGFDWQSMIPLMMSSFAGAADPRHAQQIGNSGWMAAKMRMQQEEMEREREERAERMKIAQEELKLGQQRQQQQQEYLKIAQDRAGREKEADLRGEVYNSALPEIFKYVQDGKEFTADVGWEIVNRHGKEKGIKMDAVEYMNLYENSKLLKTEKGPIMLSISDDGSATLTREVTVGGKTVIKPVTLSQGMDIKTAEFVWDSPELLERMAKDLDSKEEKAGAAGLRERATQLRTQQDRKLLMEEIPKKLSVMDKTVGAMQSIIDRNFPRNEDGTLIYPAGVAGDIAKEKEYEEKYKANQFVVDDMVLRDYGDLYKSMIRSKNFAPTVDDYLERIEKGTYKDFSGTPEEMSEMASIMKLTKGMGMDKNLAVAAARSMMDYVRRSRKNKPPGEGTEQEVPKVGPEAAWHEEVEGVPRRLPPPQMSRPPIPRTDPRVQQFGGIGYPPHLAPPNRANLRPFQATRQAAQSAGQQATDWWERRRRRSAWERMQQTR